MLNGYGYAGKILRVNLTGPKIETEAPLEKLVRDYVGGRGFVARLLWEELPPRTAPYAPENMVVVATGPLTGHLVPASGKTHFGTKSPASLGYGDANMGGHFGPTLKYAGYDVLVLTGRAECPSILVIDDGVVEIRPAGDLWGLGALTTEERLKQILGPEWQIVTIGPAGEKLVRYACLSHDFGRQAGRTGIGAVLGSKNLKAIAVRGTGSLPIFDLEGLMRRSRQAYTRIKSKPGFRGWTPEGTAGITDWVNRVGAFPTRNFQTSFFERHDRINGRAILEQLRPQDKGCYCCPTPCGKYGQARSKLGPVRVEGPEYESIALLGGALALDDIHEVAHANYICDQLGLDTISSGAVVAWAIECFEKGLLTAAEIGREIRFGELESVVFLLERIAAREGIGDLLAEGVKRAAEKVGRGSADFAIQIKGLEWSGYECRNAAGMMLAYMTADVGAHHNRAWVLGHDVTGAAGNVHDLISGEKGPEKLAKTSLEGKAEQVIRLQHLRPLFDCLGICRLQYVELGFEVEAYEELHYLVTGRRRSWDDLLAVSERVWHLTRAFSIREIEGFGRPYDYPPARFQTEPVPDGPNQGHRLPRADLDTMLDDYYRQRGWTLQGRPTPQTLRRVGLGDVARTLYGSG